MHVCVEEAGEEGGVMLVSNFNCKVPVPVLELGIRYISISWNISYFSKRCLKGKRNRKIMLSVSLCLPGKRQVLFLTISTLL